MKEFDQSKTWRPLEARLVDLTSERQRRLVQTVLDHMKAEAAGDIDGLMRTLVAEPRYHAWGPLGDTGPKGADAVRKFYTDFVASGAGVLMMEIDHLGIDDDLITYDGVMTTLGSWRVARQRGYAISEDTGHYALRMRLVNFWPFDDRGLAIGEDSYITILPDDFEQLDESQLPAVYTDYLKRIGLPV